MPTSALELKKPKPFTREERLREENREISISCVRRTRDAEAIRLHRSRGMSRRRLIMIYGSDLVHAVLGRDPELETQQR